MNSGQTVRSNKIIFGAILIVALLVVSQTVAAYLIPSTAVLHLGDGRFDIQIADNDRSRRQGLSGTEDLPADEALLFVFDQSSRWSIWMKDMNYAIDIVWLDESKEVVDFVINAQPDSYPKKTFFPKQDARYIVEFRSGTVQSKGIRVGQKAIISGTSRQL